MLPDYLRCLEAQRDFALFVQAALETLRLIGSERTGLLEGVAAEVLEEMQCSFDGALAIFSKELVKECKNLSSILLKVHSEPVGERFYLDELFSRYIAKMGPHGEKLSAELLNASLNWVEEWILDQNHLLLLRLWIDLERPPLYCRSIKLLAEVIWKDRVGALVERSQKQLMALTQSVHGPLCRLLSKQAVIREAHIFYDGKSIASIVASDPSLFSLIEKGMHLLGSIYHHKLLRHECRMGFENWVQGVENPNVLRYERGETQIAEKLGLKSKEAPSLIKAILHAQAYLAICFDDQSQETLISSLRTFRSEITQRNEGIELVLGEQLMPYYTFQTDRRSRLLVPLPEFPIFVAAAQYHAGQSLLQMLVMEEFTNRSVELSSDGWIEIPPAKWVLFFRQSGLPDSICKQVFSHWLSKDGFLTQVSVNRFSLLSQKENQFLRSQGLMRQTRQRQGKVSVRKRKQSIQK